MPHPTRRTILQLGLAAVPGASLLINRPVAAEATPVPSAPPLDRASICFRIGQPIWANEARFVELLDLFDANPGVTDEITLFTSETHPPLPLAPPPRAP